MFKWLALAVGCGSVYLGWWAIYSPALEATRRKLQEKVDRATAQLSDMYVWLPSKRLWITFLIAPLAGAGAAWLILPQWWCALLGGAVGILIPEAIIWWWGLRRKKLFNDQLVETLMIMSSSLRAGLSLLQSLEVTVEEMPPPTSQEVGMVLKEQRMGVPLQEALLHLKQRMPSDELHMVVTTILVARETGGDITHLFMQLVETIRERKKLKEKLATLTVQGRLQGLILFLLPIAFAFFAYDMNPQYFEIFFTDIVGQCLLGGAIALELLGGYLIWRFSRMPIY